MKFHLNQGDDSLNDAFEWYPRSADKGWRRILYGVLVRIRLLSERWRLAIAKSEMVINERIVECPVIFRMLPSQPKTILDIGCCSSRFPIEMSSLGHKVTGLDVRAYPFKHQNFKFIQDDIFTVSMEHGYDIITAVSVIEHFGIGLYGDKTEITAKELVTKLTEMLKSGGQLIGSMPCGIPRLYGDTHKIYSPDELRELFNPLLCESIFYYRRTESGWEPCSEGEIASVDSQCMPPKGVAIFSWKKE